MSSKIDILKRNKTLVSGLWKFDDERTKLNDIVEYAEELAKDNNYPVVYVRKTSKDQHGIGFSYIYSGEKDDFSAFTDEAQDKLYKKFGLGFVGWDLASSTIVIKGFPEEVNSK